MKTPDFQKHTLIPAIIQDSVTLKVLMLGYMNQEAFEKTINEKIVHFFSRSKNRLWKKGESSGHIQKVNKIFFDCDDDTILLQVDQVGKAACHEGYVSCFFRELDNDQFSIIENKVFDPDTVYKKSSS